MRRIRLLSAGCDTFKRSAALPKCSVSARISNARRSSSSTSITKGYQMPSNVSLDRIAQEERFWAAGYSPMIDVNWSALIGTAGTACSALSFLPQVLKVRRQGGRDLSTGMLALLLAGAGLWLAYGILNGATAVIVANIAVMILVSAVAILKVIHDQ